MTSVPFPVLVAVITLLAAGAAMVVAPGRLDVIGGTALGTGVAGVFAAVALALIRRARTGSAAATVVNTFVGLMLIRMLGYLAFLGAVVALGAGDPISVCVGLAAGTVVFQALEVVYLRKML